MNGWIGVDLDGTLAEYHGWKGPGVIGRPIPAMVERVRGWLDEGREVRIFTARVAENNPGAGPSPAVVEAIQRWCLDVLGVVLPVTNVKDFGMTELWDDRAVAVEPNTGRRLSEEPQGATTP